MGSGVNVRVSSNIYWTLMKFFLVGIAIGEISLFFIELVNHVNSKVYLYQDLFILWILSCMLFNCWNINDI